MRYLGWITAASLLATTVHAQESPGLFERFFGGDETESQEDPGGFLENLIEDNLSSDDRDVEIVGFVGALSGRATMESLTISDPDGIWLTLENAVLDWNRGALLRGRLEVAELSAERIALPRLPAPGEAAAPSPEATGFSLPELPVSVEIGKIEAARVEIGAPVFGAETIAQVSGALKLADGDGTADLDISRLNGDGQLALDASYSNASGVLALDLSLEEGADGILANLIDLPGRPSVAFSIKGDAPIDAFAADIRLATDGAERLAGQITTEKPSEPEGANLRIVADIGGDIAPIFAPEYQPFFGPDVGLRTVVTTYADGRLDLNDLSISARALDIDGNVEIAASGLPAKIDLSGQIASNDGTAVLLPLSGVETRVDRVDLRVAFDADAGDPWSGTFEIAGLDRAGFSAETLALEGAGRITDAATRAITARLDFAATALDLGNPEAEEALGEGVTGGLNIAWSDGSPLVLSDLAIEGESYGLNGGATVRFTEDGPNVEGLAEVRADRLSAFSGLAGRTLGGSAELRTGFEAAPLAGFFDVKAEGRTTDLFVSQPEADRILEGEAELSLEAARDENGLRLILNQLNSPNAEVSGRANLRTGASSFDVAARLSDAALVLPQVSGPVRFTAEGTETDGLWNWIADAALEGTVLNATGTARNLLDTPIIATNGRLAADDLNDFSTLANRTLSGSIDTTFAGEVVADLSRAQITLDGTTSDITLDQPQADALLVGDVKLVIDAALAGEVYTLNESTIEGPAISLRADGILSASDGRMALEGKLTDAAALLEGAPSGPVDFRGETTRDGRDWGFDVGIDGAALRLVADGVALDPLGPARAIGGTLQLDTPDLGAFSTLAKRDLGGSLSATASGDVTLDLSAFNVDADLSGQGLSVGLAEIDQLLAGDLSAILDAERTGDAIDVTTLSLKTTLLDLAANGSLGTDGSEMSLAGRLADVSPFVSGFSGPLTVVGTVGQDADTRFLVDVKADGPGGATANVSGSAAPDGSSVDITIDGGAPLGLANRFIEPQSVDGSVTFDLAVQGTPALSSVSGVISSSGARFVSPGLGFTLDNIQLTTRLANARADLDVTTDVSTGGRIAVSGPVALTAPFNGDLGIALNNVTLSDPQLYETSVNGTVTMSGPLTGGARIGGELQLGETNIRIPSSGLGGAGEIPEVIHINEPPPVRGTRRKAGLLEAAESRNGGGGRAFPLDIRVSAPNQVFVRGRGLDSEFGGALRITGTSKDVVPIGAFNLIRGRLDLLGQRLEIEEATVTMQGSFIPVIRIRAATQADDVTVIIQVLGPATNPEILFSSEPELPEEEVLARLIFRRGLETLSPIQAARLALAVRTLAGRGGEGVVGNIRQGAGLADFDVTTDEEGNAAVRAGAYLGENIYTDVTVNGAGDTELNLNLDVTPSVTLKGSTATSGDTSIGIFFERDY